MARVAREGTIGLLKVTIYLDTPDAVMDTVNELTEFTALSTSSQTFLSLAL
jgi:hypothetical protein